ncbi:hypothetical protein GGF46_001551 [Coemansia sp. RSA 552]|nr:hypothetical protein GGF46_001551 [Coemansia sp. RSA 552]
MRLTVVLLSSTALSAAAAAAAVPKGARHRVARDNSELLFGAEIPLPFPTPMATTAKSHSVDTASVDDSTGHDIKANGHLDCELKGRGIRVIP